MADFVRTYPYRLDDGVNEGKLHAVDALYAEWQRCLPLFNQALLDLWQSSGSMPKKLNYNQFPSRIATTLPTSTQTSMLHAIISQHASWNSNVANRFAKTITQLKTGPLAKLLIAHGLLDKDAADQDKLVAVETFKHQLFWINRYAAWFLPYNKQCELLQQVKKQYSQKLNATAQSTELSSSSTATGVASNVNANINAKTKSPSKNQPPEQITVLASRLVRRYIEVYCKRFKRPNVNNLPLAITQLTGTFDAPLKRGKKLATFFKHWLRLSTLKPNERIELPFLANAYAKQQSLRRNGVRAKSMTLLKKNGTYYLNVYYNYEAEVNDSTHVLAIDLGLTKYEQELGLEVIKVPSAYTSQMCGGCSYVSPKNRAGNVFQCKVCGKKRHADVHAAQNLLKRFQQGDVLHDMKYLPHTAWWSVLFKTHLDTINRLPLSNTCIIECARSAWSFLAKKRVSDAKYVLTNRNTSLYEVALFKLFEQVKNASSTT